MHDAHTHIRDIKVIEFLKEHHISCIVNASSQKEYEFLMKHRYDGMFISCGIHPWYATEEPWEGGDFLGEIGLDKPWCNTPFELQKEVFINQLKQNNKITFLHTKGYEKEVLDIIRLFSRKYVIHWYSSEDYLEDYLELDCFFTVGPSIGKDKAVDELVRKVPMERLLIESDGVESIEWVYEKEISLDDYKNHLEYIIQMISKIKNIPLDEVKLNLSKNFRALTCI